MQAEKLTARNGLVFDWKIGVAQRLSQIHVALVDEDPLELGKRGAKLSHQCIEHVALLHLLNVLLPFDETERDVKRPRRDFSDLEEITALT